MLALWFAYRHVPNLEVLAASYGLNTLSRSLGWLTSLGAAVGFTPHAAGTTLLLPWLLCSPAARPTAAHRTLVQLDGTVT